jgi:putative ABC transport system ATP-binding protein
VDLEIDPGRLVAIVGHNGSGKTTLLNLIAGDYYPENGAIVAWDGSGECDWTRLPGWVRAHHVARVLQDPARGTVGELTVEENLWLASLKNGIPSPFRFSTSGSSRRDLSARLVRVGLEDRFATRVDELSGGQRQMLAVELALLRRPSVLLLDEHTASLDRRNAAQCLSLTESVCREAGITVLLVTHNLSDAASFGDRVIVMQDGRIVADLPGARHSGLTGDELYQRCGYALPRTGSDIAGAYSPA